MKNLSTTIATYGTEADAENDWDALEAAAEGGTIELADAALVMRGKDGIITTTQRHSHHGWGKGAVAGAVVGLLFPPAVIAGAVVGAAGGGVVARLNRSLDQGDIRDLGKVMDAGEIAIVALTTEETAAALAGVLTSAGNTVTRASSTAEEVQEALREESGSAS